jgi:hypothetical protein
MKKEYIKPEVKVVKIQQQMSLLTLSGGSGAHIDDPQPPGSSLSPEFDFDDDFDF